MQKIAIAKKAHHRTPLSGYYIFATKARIDNRRKLVKQQYLPHMLLGLQYGELRHILVSSVLFTRCRDYESFASKIFMDPLWLTACVVCTQRLARL